MKLVLKPVQPRQGLEWVRQAIKIFGKQPLGLTGLFGTFLFFALVMLLLPVIGGVVVLSAVPLLGLVMMMGTAAAVRGQVVSPALFLAPFKTDPVRRKRLLTVCAAYGFCSLLILVISEQIDGGKLQELQELMAGGGGDDAKAREQLQVLLSDPQLLGGLYARLGLTLLLSVPFWHAPALVWWGQQGVAQALFSSTLAVWRGKGAFLAYAAAWVLLVAATGIALGLLLQALGLSSLMGALAMPLGMTLSVVFYASLYFMFVQSFGTGEVVRTDDSADEIPPDELNPPA